MYKFILYLSPLNQPSNSGKKLPQLARAWPIHDYGFVYFLPLLFFNKQPKHNKHTCLSAMQVFYFIFSIFCLIWNLIGYGPIVTKSAGERFYFDVGFRDEIMSPAETSLRHEIRRGRLLGRRLYFAAAPARVMQLYRERNVCCCCDNSHQ